ncbi:hypothetical protein F5Y03DRAFT_341053 [Xylaria venustula]|nr:hypothetical protein F5Y03DRAFT_341053 [Xylaria venustula]
MRRHIGLIWLLIQTWILPAHGVRYIYGFPQATTQFIDWYEQYGFVFKSILHDNCSQEYQNYLYGVEGNLTTIDYRTGGDEPSSITQPVIQCILNNTSDYIKSIMSSAQVLLGLTPTILSLLGPSSTELSLLTVVARRPGLAVLLALACPSVYLSRAFDPSKPLEVLSERVGRLPQWRPEGKKRLALLIFQYGTILGALSNVAVLYYQLGVRTICMFWTNGTIAPLVWGILVLPIHVLGTIVFRLQVRRLYSDEEPSDPYQPNSFGHWIKNSPKRLSELVKTELVPTACQKRMYIFSFNESITFIILNWILTPSIIIHVLFGTLVLSSLIFIGPRDALEVVGRFMVSVLVCRAILMYEIAGIRDRFNSDEGRLISLPPTIEVGNSVTKNELSSNKSFGLVERVENA